MAADLQKEFDVIVLGSGMPESIVAAACSRIGQSVLHLDRNDYYSADWASFNLQGIERWAKHRTGNKTPEDDTEYLRRPAIDEETLLEEAEHLVVLPLNNENFTNGNETPEDDTEYLRRPAIDEKTLLEEDEHLVVLPLNNENFTNVDIQYYIQDPVEDSSTESDELQKDNDDIDSKSNDQQSNQDCNDSEKVTICTYSNDSSESTHVPHIESGDNVEVEKTQKSDSNKQSVGDGKVNTELVPNFNDLTVTPDSKTDTSSDKDDVKFNESSSNVDVTPEVDDKSKSGDQNVVTNAKDNVVAENDASSSLDTQGTDDTEISKEETEIDTDLNKEEATVWSKSRLNEEWRRFNLDLSPKVLYCGGEMVELLISSDIAKYCEFKTVTRVLTVLEGKVEKVPCSRSDVFSSKKVSMLEKRMLMKFLQFCLDYHNKTEEIEDFFEKPFKEFLSSRKLTANIKHFVQHSIAMATDSMTTKQGLERTQKFLQSIGRYGNTAFLWSLYGSGELPQSFCRMCAVFGGTYCLRMSASSVILDKDNKCKGIVTTEGQRIGCKYLIMESTYSPESFILAGSNRYISRGIIVTDKQLLPSDSQELSMLCIPCPDGGDRPIQVLELPPTAMACPPDLYIFHLTRQSKDGTSPKDDLSCALEILFKTENSEEETVEDKPRVLWSLYFTQKDNSFINCCDKLPDNVFLLSGPGTEVDIDRPVQEARELFKKILPNEEFLPKAPNPEDIIYIDDNEAKVSEDSSQSEFGEQDSNQSQQTKDSTETGSVDQESNISQINQENSNQSDVQAKDSTETGSTDQVSNISQLNQENCNQSDASEISDQSQSSSQQQLSNQSDVQKESCEQGAEALQNKESSQ